MTIQMTKMETLIGEVTLDVPFEGGYFLDKTANVAVIEQAAFITGFGPGNKHLDNVLDQIKIGSTYREIFQMIDLEVADLDPEEIPDLPFSTEMEGPDIATFWKLSVRSRIVGLCCLTCWERDWKKRIGQIVNQSLFKEVSDDQFSRCQTCNCIIGCN